MAKEMEGGRLRGDMSPIPAVTASPLELLPTGTGPCWLLSRSRYFWRGVSPSMEALTSLNPAMASSRGEEDKNEEDDAFGSAPDPAAGAAGAPRAKWTEGARPKDLADSIETASVYLDLEVVQLEPSLP